MTTDLNQQFYYSREAIHTSSIYIYCNCSKWPSVNTAGNLAYVLLTSNSANFSYLLF